MIVDVGSAQDFSEGVVRPVAVAQRTIGIVRWRGSLYALRDRCPHQGGPVCRGLLRPALVAGPAVGDISVDDARLVLSCPWHGWEFDVATGRALGDGGYRIATYRVSEDRGRVLLEVAG
jgi:nitrite reductase/ring-hydroxylating ferredoxin subunit